MSKKEDDAYAKWAEEYKSKLPAELQQNFEALVGHESGKELFRGHLREQEFHSRLNQINQEKQLLTKEKEQYSTWWQSAKPEYDRAVAEAAEAKANQGRLQKLESTLKELGLVEDDPEVPNKRGADVSNTRIQELEERLGKMDQLLPQVLAEYGSIMLRTAKEGWSVDPKAVLEHALTNRTDLNRAFDALTSEERAAREKKRFEDAIAKAKEEARREALSQSPSPDFPRPNGPTIVEILRKAGGDPTERLSRVNEAVSEFMEKANLAS